MDGIGKNTERGKDLKRRAQEIFDKERAQKAAKQTAKELGEDIKVLYRSAASHGYNADALHDVLQEMHMEPEAREEHYQLQLLFNDERDIYRHALGLVDGEDGPDEEEPTISLNGGPAHPMSVVREAVDIVKARNRRREPAEADA